MRSNVTRCRQRRFLLWILLACSGASALDVSAGEIERETSRLIVVEAPAQSEVAWVARSMRLNGLPLTIKSFRTPLSASEVERFYASWSLSFTGSHRKVTRDGRWLNIAIKLPHAWVSIRVADDGIGAQGTIAVSPPLQTAALAVHTQFPLPAATQIVNLQEYDDAGIEAEHISMVSRESPGSEAGNFRALLVHEGWSIVRAGAAQEIRGGRIIEAQKGAQLALLTLQPRANFTGSTIIAVWRK